MSTEIDALTRRVRNLEEWQASVMVSWLRSNPLNAKCDSEGKIEPAPGSDADHPPLGYRLAKKGDLRQKGYIWWDSDEKIWELSACYNTGMPVDMETGDVVANPIPANEGDGMVESLADRVADSIADDVQRMQVAIETLTDDRDRALARVAELEGELVVLRKTNRSYHMTITDLNDRLRMVREAAR